MFQMQAHNESSKTKEEKKYVREDLRLGSFILHANASENKGYISCQCDQQCKYVIMNEEKKIQKVHVGHSEQMQIFEESRNKGYPEELNLILKENIIFFEFLRELYSIYMHAQVSHHVFVEFAMGTQFFSALEKEKYVQSVKQDSIIMTFEDMGPQYQFTVFNKKNDSKQVTEVVFYVVKSGSSLWEKTESRFVVTENEWIVLFSWFLTNQKLLQHSYKPEYERIMKRISKSSSTLQGKLNEIRKRSFTRLYDFSCFYGPIE